MSQTRPQQASSPTTTCPVDPPLTVHIATTTPTREPFIHSSILPLWFHNTPTHPHLTLLTPSLASPSHHTTHHPHTTPHLTPHPTPSQQPYTTPHLTLLTPSLTSPSHHTTPHSSPHSLTATLHHTTPHSSPHSLTSSSHHTHTSHS